MPIRLILVTILLLGGGGLVWFSLQANGAPPLVAEATPVTVKIIAAATQTQAGTLLKDADMREQDIPQNTVTDDMLVSSEDSRNEIRGAMLRHYMESGTVIRRSDILRPRDRGFLAAVLAPGTRAVSVGVDATTGASGLISPGDLVDVLLTQEFARGETSAGRRVVAETVLSSVRVIAVDQQITQGAPTGSGVAGIQAARVASNVSLEVTPDQAAKVVVAGRLGRLTLVVRSIDLEPAAAKVALALPGDPARPALTARAASTSVFGSDVSSALSSEEPAASPRLRLIQGDAVSDVTFK